MIFLALLAAGPIILGFALVYGLFRLVGTESTAPGMVWIRRSVLIGAAVFFVVAVALYEVTVMSLCAVSVRNTGNTTVDVTVLAETQYVGTARLAPGERLFRLFYANTEGAMKVACRKPGNPAAVTQDFDYVTGDSPAYYSMTVSSCAMERDQGTVFL